MAFRQQTTFVYTNILFREKRFHFTFEAKKANFFPSVAAGRHCRGLLLVPSVRAT